MIKPVKKFLKPRKVGHGFPVAHTERSQSRTTLGARLEDSRECPAQDSIQTTVEKPAVLQL